MTRSFHLPAPASRSALAAICILAITTAVHAQEPAARMEKARAELQKRFDAADANKDGKLTREEAQAKMPMVHKSFAAIDTHQSGAVSLADIEKFLMTKKGKRKSAS